MVGICCPLNGLEYKVGEVAMSTITLAGLLLGKYRREDVYPPVLMANTTKVIKPL